MVSCSFVHLALVTNINLGKSISQRVPDSNWYPINPSIAAIKELVSCEGDTISSISNIPTGQLLRAIEE